MGNLDSSVTFDGGIIPILTSDPTLKEAVLGVFDLAEIVAGGSKNN
jgi:hypothetical protein